MSNSMKAPYAGSPGMAPKVWQIMLSEVPESETKVRDCCLLMAMAVYQSVADPFFSGCISCWEPSVNAVARLSKSDPRWLVKNATVRIGDHRGRIAKFHLNPLRLMKLAQADRQPDDEKFMYIVKQTKWGLFQVPGDTLIDVLPKEEDAEYFRAYISNVGMQVRDAAFRLPNAFARGEDVRTALMTLGTWLGKSQPAEWSEKVAHLMATYRTAVENHTT